MLEIRRRLPFGLSGSSTSETATYLDAYNAYDFAIGGVPFLSAVSQDNPYVVKSAPFRKQQVDQSQEVGEQSLTGWWSRSQLSYHGGAGLLYTDPALDESAPYRYLDSEGVDPWTPGQVTLLPQATKVLTSAASDKLLMVGGRVATTDLVVWTQGITAGYVHADGTTGTVTITGATLPFQSMTSDGTSYYASNPEGVWKIDFASPSSASSAKLWTLPGGSISTTLGWVKGRLMAGVGTKLYELVPPAGSPPYALPATAVYTSLIPGWAWSSITAGPEAIYVAGYSGNRGSILRVAVDTQGALPTLTGATEVAQLPTGEYPLAIRAYLGTLMGIGTNKGARVADIQSGGSLSYGPLTETPMPVTDLVSVDRFMFITYSQTSNKTGLMRIDLSLKHPSGRYAYAKDLLTADLGTVQSVALIGDTGRVGFTVNGQGIYFQDATVLVASGYLKTAATRYNTLWPKLFKRLSIRAIIQGSIVVDTVDQNGNQVTIATLTDQTDLSQDLSINAPDSPQEQLGILLTLNRDTPTTGPLFRGYLLKASPGGPRQHTYIVPLLCMDSEKDSNGNVMGYPSYGYERLSKVMATESMGSVVLFEDLMNSFSVLVTIEEIEFRQTAPGGGAQPQWGGVLTLQLRTLD